MNCLKSPKKKGGETSSPKLRKGKHGEVLKPGRRLRGEVPGTSGKGLVWKGNEKGENPLPYYEK